MSTTATDDFFDTNVAIECHRIGAWDAFRARFKLITVEKVIEECGTGGGRREGYVKIDIQAMQQGHQGTQSLRPRAD